MRLIDPTPQPQPNAGPRFAFTISILGTIVPHPVTGEMRFRVQTQDAFIDENARRGAIVALQNYLQQQAEKATGLILPGLG